MGYPRPLPRSLEPLTDETLTGYLLRLSHRLSVSPAHIAQRIGLNIAPTGGRLRRNLILELTDVEIDMVCATTRLAPVEVDSMTMRTWIIRYPALGASLQHHNIRPQLDPWLTPDLSRYCPQCLAGDGSEIQNRHGGPWKKEWHLPIIFSCIAHNRFLQSGCPSCLQPTHSTWQPSPLIARSGDGTLHPTQCRQSIAGRRRGAKPCGNQLASTTKQVDPPLLSPDLLAFQKYINSFLTSERTTEESSAYFTDLRIVCALLATSWPHSRHLVARNLTKAVQTHVRLLQERRGDQPWGKQSYRTLDSPPATPQACAGLFRAADRILCSEDADLPDVLTHYFETSFVDRNSGGTWKRLAGRNLNHCSQRLRQATKPLTYSFSPIELLDPHTVCNYKPYHIPAWLEPEWYVNYFGRLDPNSARTIRRIAAVRLLQWATGGTPSEAANILDIPADKITRHIETGKYTWNPENEERAEFATALQSLANDLSTYIPLIDYRHRRTALRNWSIPLKSWHELSRLLPVQYGKQPILDDRKRQVASILVWTRITHGEHLFAPRPIEERQPEEIRRDWAARRATTWHQLCGRSDPGPHYSCLRQLLTIYAGKLAQQIDASAPGASSIVEAPNTLPWRET
ncbi:hypothetical protein C6Y14_28790 [Streptomyces dioscori]|uniref:TniQ domain-containing protein n=1 Tax=Streptomyces dioscori TaxID=2109333 RepID=A0A2P8Q188_9ACTN|nr:hypothetical protein C6Y14_28790 [Streptomyces dioscori]